MGSLKSFLLYKIVYLGINMRLSEHEVSCIKNIVLEFDPNALIYLYGSRIDDTKKGGDIALMLVSEVIDLEQKIKIKLRLYDTIGEQKIDLLITKSDNSDPFIKIVKNKGILL